MNDLTVAEARADCQQEGWDEQRLGGSITANPYQLGSQRWVWWRQGYNRAVERRHIPSGALPTWKVGL
jgi:hypothetical protein